MEHQAQFKVFAKGKVAVELGKGNNAVIYTRVSSKEQADTNHSLETQKKYCEDYCNKNNFNVLGYFGGTYESAMTDEREEFNRMMKFVKNKKEGISHIFVYTLDRFSRSGENAIYISSQLKALGISIIAVTQPIDVSTSAGQLQQNIQFVFSKYDNDLRRKKCIDGMREKLLKGEWIGHAPIGYSFDYANGLGKEQKIVFNEKAKLIKEIFLWKAGENMSLPMILRKLRARGLKMHIQSLAKVLHNPFYCGLVTHNLLQGEIVKGKHPALISNELFLRANGNAKTNGFKQSKVNDFLPLKQFVQCGACGTAFTGYLVKKRGIYYYKCNKRGCKCNRSAKLMHVEFEKLLGSFTSNTKFIGPIKKQLEYTFNSLTKSNTSNQKAFEMRICELKDKIEKVQERYALGEIERPIFEKVFGKLKEEKAQVEQELEKSRIKLSNPKELIDFTVNLSSKLYEIWQKGDFTQKQNFQKMLFPDGVQYDGQNNTYRTTNSNSVFTAIAEMSRSYEENKKGSFDFSIENSPSVPGGGLEPPHLAAYAPQTYLSTNSNIRAKELQIIKKGRKNKDFPA
jgi:site-specific DNA recombinase